MSIVEKKNINEYRFQVFIDGKGLSSMIFVPHKQMTKEVLLKFWSEVNTNVSNILENGLYGDITMSDAIINKQYDGFN